MAGRRVAGAVDEDIRIFDHCNVPKIAEVRMRPICLTIHVLGWRQRRPNLERY